MNSSQEYEARLAKLEAEVTRLFEACNKLHQYVSRLGADNKADDMAELKGLDEDQQIDLLKAQADQIIAICESRRKRRLAEKISLEASEASGEVIVVALQHGET